jgi:hypothetical protein
MFISTAPTMAATDVPITTSCMREQQKVVEW